MPAPPTPAPDSPAAQAVALVRAMAAGDRRALSGLIRLHGPGLTSYCARALDRPGEAEDAAQEVFLKAWTAAARFDPDRGAVSTWLYRIALNQCIDMNRRGRFRRFLGLAEAPEPAEEAPDAFRTLAGREEAAQLRAAVAALPDRQRQALLLRVVGELDNSAIAVTMGTGIGAVEQLLVRARATLRARTGLDLSLE